MELGERDECLGLRPVVLVGALEGIDRDARFLLAGEPFLRLGARGVGLQGEGLGGGEQLHEVGEPRPVLRQAGIAEQFGLAVEQGVEPTTKF